MAKRERNEPTVAEIAAFIQTISRLTLSDRVQERYAQSTRVVGGSELAALRALNRAGSLTYGDLAVPGTGERLTESTFRKYQAQNKLVAAYAIPEEDVVTGLQTDWIMIGSDAILLPANNNHPRASGCFTRVLGRYVRDQQVLSLTDADRKSVV